MEQSNPLAIAAFYFPRLVVVLKKSAIHLQGQPPVVPQGIPFHQLSTQAVWKSKA